MFFFFLVLSVHSVLIGEEVVVSSSCLWPTRVRKKNQNYNTGLEMK